MENTPNNELFEQPEIVSISENAIVIRGLPVVNMHTLGNSKMLKIVHRLKHLYKDGDRDGASEYKKKRKAREPRENDYFRLCVTYTYSFGFDEKGPYLTIGLFVSSDENSAHFLEPSLGHIKKKKMAPWEITSYAAKFSQDCAEELQKFLDDIYYDAQANNIPPNYFEPFSIE